MGCVYLVKNKINGKSYVGKTIYTIEKRKLGHLKNQVKFPISNAIRKYGLENFDWFVLMESHNEAELFQVERECIKKLGTKVPSGYNLTDGGEGVSGYTQSEEHKKKLSAVHKGKKLSEEHKRKLSLAGMGKRHGPMSEKQKEKLSLIRRLRKHKPLSEETKRKISIAHMGMKASKEAKAKMSAYNLGKKLTEETKRKMSLARSGKKRGPMSEEQKIKLSNTHRERKIGIGRIRGPMSHEHKEKLSLAHKGHKTSEETRIKISKALMGRKFSAETRLKISMAKKRNPF